MGPRLGSAESFDRLRALLHQWEFDEEGLAHPPGPEDPRGLLARLFLQKLPAPLEQAQTLLGAEGLGLLTDLGLVAAEGDEVHAQWLLYPLRGLYIASDFPGADAPDDFVFPAISQQTWEFLSILLETPCEDLLEIGTGSGAAALTASRYAKKALAGDVSPRCLHFAEFNRRLNGIDNVEVLESDVFAGVGEQTFDRIIAHPPYVPWTGRQDAYRHGGPDGEAVLRRLIEGLSDRLRPGGRLYAATMGLDTGDAPLEDRLREMLGDKRDEFDILLVEREILTPLEFVLPWIEGEGLTFQEAWSLSEALLERKAKALVRCSLIIARHDSSQAESVEPRTIRRKAGRGTDAAAIEETLSGDAVPGWLSWDELLEQTFELSPDATLETVSVPHGGAWRPRAAVLDAQTPFAFRTDCPVWAMDALPLLDGRRTLREALDGAEVAPDEGEAFLYCLLSAGVLS